MSETFYRTIGTNLYDLSVFSPRPGEDRLPVFIILFAKSAKILLGEGDKQCLNLDTVNHCQFVVGAFANYSSACTPSKFYCILVYEEMFCSLVGASAFILEFLSIYGLLNSGPFTLVGTYTICLDGIGVVCFLLSSCSFRASESTWFPRDSF